MDFKFVLERLSEIKDALADVNTKVEVSNALHKQNTKSLDEHILRTNLLEDKVDILRKNQTWWSITGKVLLILCAVGTFIYMIWKG